MTHPLYKGYAAPSETAGLGAVLALVLIGVIFLPPLKAAGFDVVWFGVVMTIVMGRRLIHRRSGLTSSLFATSRPTFRSALS